MTAMVRLAQANISYQVDGQGEGLVLVSGTGGDLHSNWDHLMGRFTACRQVVRVDYAGSGKTQDHGGVLQVEALAAQVMSGVGAAQLGKFDLVGYSLGAAVAIYIAAQYPQHVRSLVLVAGFAHGGQSRLGMQSDLWLQLIQHDPRAFAKVILLTGFSPQFLNAMAPGDIENWIDAICTSNRWDGISRQIDLDRRLDVREYLGQIQARTLVIGCANDFMVPKAHAQDLAEAISGARYVELQSGHLVPFECPDVFADTVLHFIESV